MHRKPPKLYVLYCVGIVGSEIVCITKVPLVLECILGCFADDCVVCVDSEFFEVEGGHLVEESQQNEEHDY